MLTSHTVLYPRQPMGNALAVCAESCAFDALQTYLVLHARLVTGVVIHGLLHDVALCRLALALDVGRAVLDALHLLVLWLSRHIVDEGRVWEGRFLYGNLRLVSVNAIAGQVDSCVVAMGGQFEGRRFEIPQFDLQR